MKRTLTIITLYTLSPLFAVDIDSRVENITNHNHKNTSENQAVLPVDVDRVQEIRQIKHSLEQDLARQVLEKHLARKTASISGKERQPGNHRRQEAKYQELKKMIDNIPDLKDQLQNAFPAKPAKTITNSKVPLFQGISGDLSNQNKLTTPSYIPYPIDGSQIAIKKHTPAGRRDSKKSMKSFLHNQRSIAPGPEHEGRDEYYTYGPRIAMFLTDLNSEEGGAVYFDETEDYATVTYFQVPVFGEPSNTNTFQVQLYYNTGEIVISYTDLYLNGANTDQAQGGLAVGIADGTCGIQELDLSEAFGECGNPWPTEGFSSENELDLEYTKLTFTPDPNDFSDFCVSMESIIDLPASYSNEISVSDDDYTEQTLSSTFEFYNTSYDMIFINNDGNIGFESGDEYCVCWFCEDGDGSDCPLEYLAGCEFEFDMLEERLIYGENQLWEGAELWSDNSTFEEVEGAGIESDQNGLVWTETVNDDGAQAGFHYFDSPNMSIDLHDQFENNWNFWFDLKTGYQGELMVSLWSDEGINASATLDIDGNNEWNDFGFSFDELEANNSFDPGAVELITFQILNTVIGRQHTFGFVGFVENDDDDDDEFLLLGEFGGHQYYLSPFETNWIDANNFINDNQEDDISVHMVTIGSQEENDFLSEVWGNDLYWIGFTDEAEEGNWQWVTGEEVVYTNWHDDQPDNNNDEQHYASSNYNQPGFWDDEGIDFDHPFIVELEPGDEDEFLFLGEFEGHQYYLSQFETTWTDANNFINDNQEDDYSVHMVTIGSQEENDFLSEVWGDDEYWIGFTDEAEEGNWQWVTGEEVTYTNWADGEPNNLDDGQHYAVSNFANDPGFWDDEFGGSMFPFMIEFEIDDYQLTAFDILINGEESATIVAGDQEIQITMIFDTNGEPPYIGMLSIFYDANFDGELDDNDFNLLGELEDAPALMIVDNMEDDENPEVGVLELTFNLGDEDEPNFMTLIQNAAWFFASLDPDDQSIDDVAVLNVVGSGSDFSVSGGTDPATANMLAIAFPMGDDNEEDPEEFFLSFTQGDGSYHIDVPEPGQYVIGLEDIFEIHPDLYVYPPFQSVDVQGEMTGLDFSIYVYTTLVYGHVENESGEPIEDAEVEFHYEEYPDSDIHSMGYTDPEGYYELWVLGGYEYEVNAWADGYMDHSGSADVGDVEDFEYNIVLESDGGGSPGWIEGSVWDEAGGETISNASVQAYNNDHMFETWTDDNGWFEFEVPPGGYWVTAGAEGYMEGTIEVQVYPGETTQTEFFLSPAENMYVVSGMAVSENGDRLSGVQIAYNNLEEGWWSSVYTDEMGMFEEEIPGGVYNFSARVNDYYVAWIYDQEVFEDIWLDFTLTPVEEFTGSVEGMIIFHGGDGMGEWASVNAWNDVYDGRANGDDDGYYYIPLVDGTYNLTIRADGYPTQFVSDAFTIEGNNVVYDVHLYEQGFVGPPHIVFLGDVPNDQGRQMRVVWNPGVPGEWDYFTQFSIWRLVPENQEELWDYVTTVPWHGMQPYSAVVPTLGDSTDQEIYWSTFMVSAHTEDPNFFLDSEPATGYSVDNLHPAIPEGVMANQTGEGILLSWSAPVDEDFNYHRVYRHNLDSEDPADIFTTVDTFFVDASVTDGSWEYWVTAVDLAGNESDASETVSVLLSADDELALPTEFALVQNYPNPFNPSTQVRYALPEEANVVLVIYDLMGRKVRTLVNGTEPAGYQSVPWNATNDRGLPVSAGVYICTIQAGEYRGNMKMILLK